MIRMFTTIIFTIAITLGLLSIGYNAALGIQPMQQQQPSSVVSFTDTGFTNMLADVTTNMNRPLPVPRAKR